MGARQGGVTRRQTEGRHVARRHYPGRLVAGDDHFGRQLYSRNQYALLEEESVDEQDYAGVHALEFVPSGVRHTGVETTCSLMTEDKFISRR